MVDRARDSPLAQLAEPAKAPAGPHPHGDRFHQCRRGVQNCRLTGRYEVARALAFTSPAPQVKALADVPFPPAPIPAPIPRPPAPIPTPPVADTAGVTEVYAQAQPSKPVRARSIRPMQETRPLFQVMFTDGPRHGVSQAVNTLWASGKGEPQVGGQLSGLLNLFGEVLLGLRKSPGGKV